MLVLSIIYPHFDRFRIATVGKGNACLLVRVLQGLDLVQVTFVSNKYMKFHTMVLEV